MKMLLLLRTYNKLWNPQWFTPVVWYLNWLTWGSVGQTLSVCHSDKTFTFLAQLKWGAVTPRFITFQLWCCLIWNKPYQFNYLVFVLPAWVKLCVLELRWKFGCWDLKRNNAWLLMSSGIKTCDDLYSCQVEKTMHTEPGEEILHSLTNRRSTDQKVRFRYIDDFNSRRDFARVAIFVVQMCKQAYGKRRFRRF